MNKDMFESQWGQFKAYAREKWSNLTDEDIRQINGRYDQLIAKLQQRYGYTREEAEAELRNWNVDRSRSLGNERTYTGAREDDALRRRTDDSSVMKWVLAAGLPLLLIASYLAYDGAKTHETYTDSRPAAQESTYDTFANRRTMPSQDTLAAETPEDRIISQNIQRAVMNNNQLTPTLKNNVRFQTANGVVTISGTVGSAQERDVILGIVDNIQGIRQVNNQLQIRSQ